MNPVLEEKKQAELEFWHGLSGNCSSAEFATIRTRDFEDYAEHFREIWHQNGLGLDLGSGPWSVFESLNYEKVIAADPLMEQYQQFIHPPRAGVSYQQIEDDNLGRFVGDTFDWVWCVNVVDHTPNPERLLKEVRRVLKPGGLFYFGVWFDKSLYQPHYTLWNMDTVNEYLKDFQLLRGTLELWEAHNKYRWWGLYR